MTLWTIDELSLAVTEALRSAGYDGPLSARVRPVPDERTIRYYTTIGLLDRPLEMRGRTALYGRRHLLQLVAIKRLQARGLSLVQVQQHLAGADDRTLGRWAGLNREVWARLEQAAESKAAAERADPAQAVPRRSPSRRAALAADLCSPAADGAGRVAGIPPVRDRFWESEPATAPDAVLKPTGLAPIESQPVLRLVLAEGVTLLLEGVGPQQLQQATLQLLEPPVRSLLQTLRRLGLTLPRGAHGAEAGDGSSDRPIQERKDP